MYHQTDQIVATIPVNASLPIHGPLTCVITALVFRWGAERIPIVQTVRSATKRDTAMSAEGQTSVQKTLSVYAISQDVENMNVGQKSPNVWIVEKMLTAEMENVFAKEWEFIPDVWTHV